MKRRAFLLAAGALVAPAAVRAQRGVPRIGVIPYNDTYTSFVEGLRVGLKELGIVEGRDVVLEIRDGKGDARVMEEAARGFERERAALVYSVPMSATVAVKRATSTVPVVFSTGSDPIAAGFVASLAKPGGRLTGVHYLTADLTAKRMELLKQVLPKVSRVVTAYNPGNPAAVESSRNAREAAKKLGIRLTERHVRSVSELRAALGAIKPGEFDAFFTVSDAAVTGQARLLIERSIALRLPLVVFDQAIVERGAMLSYGVDTREVGRQSAKYVQRILAGAQPQDLPVETVTRLVYAINRRTAQQIGLSVPPDMLVRFDRVIE